MVKFIKAKLNYLQRAEKLFMIALTVCLLDAIHQTDKMLPIFKICITNELSAL